mmetsp:Transcript_31711/g.88865  ORF Transcript_31711/g.88865 Transcript_31711/m.88865 type:complete len:243 (-) Transcript_31711:53-781(-)
MHASRSTAPAGRGCASFSLYQYPRSTSQTLWMVFATPSSSSSAASGSMPPRWTLREALSLASFVHGPPVICLSTKLVNGRHSSVRLIWPPLPLSAATSASTAPCAPSRPQSALSGAGSQRTCMGRPASTLKHSKRDRGRGMRTSYGPTMSPKKGSASPSLNRAWKLAWLSTSFNEGTGANVGCEWYHPTHCRPRRSISPRASTSLPGSISHESVPSVPGRPRHGKARATRSALSAASHVPPR